MRLGILTDIHICPPGSPASGWHNPHQFASVRERLAQSLDFLNSQNLDRLVVLGDTANFGDHGSLREALATLTRSTAPVWIIPGNHDLDERPDSLAHAIAADGHTTIEVLDATPRPLTTGWQVVGTGLARVGDLDYAAEPVPDIASWGDTPTLAFSHYPLLPIRENFAQAGLKYDRDLANIDAIVTPLLARTAPTLVFHGHVHVRTLLQQAAVLQVACGAQIESLFEATVVDLSPTGVAWQATNIQPIWNGTKVDLIDPSQAWQWTGTTWSPLAG